MDWKCRVKYINHFNLVLYEIINKLFCSNIKAFEGKSILILSQYDAFMNNLKSWTFNHDTSGLRLNKSCAAQAVQAVVGLNIQECHKQILEKISGKITVPFYQKLSLYNLHFIVIWHLGNRVTFENLNSFSLLLNEICRINWEKCLCKKNLGNFFPIIWHYLTAD